MPFYRSLESKEHRVLRVLNEVKPHIQSLERHLINAQRKDKLDLLEEFYKNWFTVYGIFWDEDNDRSKSLHSVDIYTYIDLLFFVTFKIQVVAKDIEEQGHLDIERLMNVSQKIFLSRELTEYVDAIIYGIDHVFQKYRAKNNRREKRNEYNKNRYAEMKKTGATLVK